MTPTNTLLWPYLLPILEEQKAKNGVVYIQKSDGNGMDRMISDSVSSDVYPGIFVMLPRYKMQEVENHIQMVFFSAILYVWCKPPQDQEPDQDAAYQQAETIASDIITRLKHERRIYKNYLDFDSIHLDPVLHLSADATYGYELKFRLGLPANEIYG